MASTPTTPPEPENTPPTAASSSGSFGMVLMVAALMGALVAGFVLAKITTPSPIAGAPAATPGPSTAADGHVHTGGMASAGSQVGGLAVSSGGYTIVPEWAGGQITFTVKDPLGKVQKDFAIVHDKLLHLIVVRRDMTGYQHLHPDVNVDGLWSTPANLATPGMWRAFADFSVVTIGGTQIALTLGFDITVPGDYQPQPFPPPARDSTVDGLTVTFEGTPAVGATSPLLFRVFRDGAPVADLQPYLGSYGHLVVLRHLDLGYVHVHPEPQLAGGAVKLWISAPSPGTYRMFFDFQVGGTVRTAQYTLVVP